MLTREEWEAAVDRLIDRHGYYLGDRTYEDYCARGHDHGTRRGPRALLTPLCWIVGHDPRMTSQPHTRGDGKQVLWTSFVCDRCAAPLVIEQTITDGFPGPAVWRRDKHGGRPIP